jgi:hypothetical protein
MAGCHRWKAPPPPAPARLIAGMVVSGAGGTVSAKPRGENDIAYERDDGRTVILRGAQHWGTPELWTLPPDARTFEMRFPDSVRAVRWRGATLTIRGKEHDLAKPGTYVFDANGDLLEAPR